MFSVASASRYIKSSSRYYPRYQSRSSIYIRGLIPRNFAELAEAVPLGKAYADKIVPDYCLFAQGLLFTPFDLLYCINSNPVINNILRGWGLDYHNFQLHCFHIPGDVVIYFQTLNTLMRCHSCGISSR